jgi:hypothetical protein
MRNYLIEKVERGGQEIQEREGAQTLHREPKFTDDKRQYSQRQENPVCARKWSIRRIQ